MRRCLKVVALAVFCGALALGCTKVPPTEPPNPGKGPKVGVKTGKGHLVEDAPPPPSPPPPRPTKPSQ